jgi:hypothetical protein
MLLAINAGGWRLGEQYKEIADKVISLMSTSSSYPLRYLFSNGTHLYAQWRSQHGVRFVAWDTSWNHVLCEMPFREVARSISELTGQSISHQGARNVDRAVGEKQTDAEKDFLKILSMAGCQVKGRKHGFEVCPDL